MTVEDNLRKFAEARSNPCAENEHEYSHMVNPMGKATMLGQICTKCFDTMGWIYDWQEEKDAE